MGLQRRKPRVDVNLLDFIQQVSGVAGPCDQLPQPQARHPAPPAWNVLWLFFMCTFSLSFHNATNHIIFYYLYFRGWVHLAVMRGSQRGLLPGSGRMWVGRITLWSLRARTLDTPARVWIPALPFMCEATWACCSTSLGFSTLINIIGKIRVMSPA